MKRLMALVVLAALALSASPAAADGRVVSGTASTYGEGYDGYLALPEGRGVRVKVCSSASGSYRCVTRTSNDAGPSKGMQREGRVIDLDVPTFEYLCQCDWRVLGLMPVTVEYLSKGSRPQVTPPPTDTEESVSWGTFVVLPTQQAPVGASGRMIPQ